MGTGVTPVASAAGAPPPVSADRDVPSTAVQRSVSNVSLLWNSVAGSR